MSHAAYQFSGTQSVVVTSNVQWVSMLNVPIELIGFPVLIAYILGEEAVLLAAVVMGFIGPFIVFIGWIIILYAITYIYSRIKSAKASPSQVDIPKTYKVSNKALTIVSVIIILLLCVGNLAYNFSLEQSTFTALSAEPPTGQIVSISPSSARVGDTINITMSGVDHASYFSVDLIKSDADSRVFPGSLGRLWRNTVPVNNIISFVLQAKNCPIYAGTSCDLPLVNVTPGTYKLRFSSSKAQYSEDDFTIVQ